MPKQKSHSGAKKRFTLTGGGKLKRAKMNRRHILTKKASKRKRGLRKHSDQEGVQEKARLAQDCLRIRNAGKDHQDDDRIVGGVI